MIIMIRVLILVLLLLAVSLLFYRSPELICIRNEGFKNPDVAPGNPFPPLGMNVCRDLPDGSACMDVNTALQTEGSRPLFTGVDVPPAGPIVSLNSNDVPLSFINPQRTFEEEPYKVEDGQTIYPPWGNKDPGSFEQLTEKTGKYRFKIPELLYDGIWKKDNKEWVLPIPTDCQVKGTYGADKLSPIAERCLFGQTIVDPAECAGLVYPSPPPLTYVYNC